MSDEDERQRTLTNAAANLHRILFENFEDPADCLAISWMLLSNIAASGIISGLDDNMSQTIADGVKGDIDQLVREYREFSKSTMN